MIKEISQTIHDTLHRAGVMAEALPGPIGEVSGLAFEMSADLGGMFKGRSREEFSAYLQSGSRSDTIGKVDAALVPLTGRSGIEWRTDLNLDVMRQQAGEDVDPEKYGALSPKQVKMGSDAADGLLRIFEKHGASMLDR